MADRTTLIRDGGTQIGGVTMGRGMTNGSRGLMKYEVVLSWSEEDDAFIAQAPELPGCAGKRLTYRKLTRK